MKIYDAKRSSISVKNRVLTGFGPNDMFTYASKEERIQTEVDAQGNASASINNARLAQITVNLSASSPDYKWLSDLSNNMEQFPVVIKTDVEKITVNTAYVSKPADVAAGKATGLRTFTIECLDSNVEVIE